MLIDLQVGKIADAHRPGREEGDHQPVAILHRALQRRPLLICLGPAHELLAEIEQLIGML